MSDQGAERSDLSGRAGLRMRTWSDGSRGSGLPGPAFGARLSRRHSLPERIHVSPALFGSGSDTGSHGRADPGTDACSDRGSDAESCTLPDALKL